MMDYSSISWGSGMPIKWHDEDEERFWNKKNNLEMKQSSGNKTLITRINPVCILLGHTNDVTSVQFAGCSLLATSSLDKTIRIYKYISKNHFKLIDYSPLTGHKYGINSLSFSPYGSKIASASTDGQTFMWDVKTGEKLVMLQLESQSKLGVRACAFSPNSAMLATGGEGEMATLWNISLFSLIRELRGHDSTVTSVSFSPDSVCLATGSANGDLKFFDAAHGHSLPLLTKVEAHDLGITSVCFNPMIGKEGSFVGGTQYLLATSGQDTDLHLWIIKYGTRKLQKNSLEAHSSIELHHTLCGHKAPIMMVAFAPSGVLLASASGDKTVRIWDTVKLSAVAILEGHERYVTSCTFSEDGLLVAGGSGDRKVCVWSVDEASLSGFKDLQKTQQESRSKHKELIEKFCSPKAHENKKVINWSSFDVSAWLVENGLGEYSSNFRSQLINGRELIALNDFTLESKLGVEALGHRNRILRFIEKNSETLNDDNVPNEFICPITQESMKDPVLCADGYSYERDAMEAWLASGKKTSPMTNATLTHFMLTPNRTLKNLISTFSERNS